VPAAGTALYVSVFSVQRAQHTMLSSPGASRGARWQGIGAPVRLRYRLDRGGGWWGWLFGSSGGRCYHLSLTADQALRLPALRLIGDTTAPPEHPDQGAVLATFAAGTELQPRQTRRLRFRLSGTRRWYARLFPVVPEQAAGVELVSDSPRGHRIG
jgi:hypothetical protein